MPLYGGNYIKIPYNFIVRRYEYHVTKIMLHVEGRRTRRRPKKDGWVDRLREREYMSIKKLHVDG